MKPKEWEGNGNGLHCAYHISHDGPNYFLTCYKGTSRIHSDPKDAWRVSGVAKFTASMQELKQWCLDTHEKYDKELKKARKDTSFASEVQTEDKQEEDPTSNTKMITQAVKK